MTGKKEFLIDARIKLYRGEPDGERDTESPSLPIGILEVLAGKQTKAMTKGGSRRGLRSGFER